jgi:hypothetical protein
MLTGIKINISIIICFTFIFRLLFVNISFVSNINSQVVRTNKSSFSSALKRNRHSESFNNFKSEEIQVLEICEDDSNDDDKFKSKIFLLTRAFYLLVTNKTIDEAQEIISTDKLLSNTLSHRYIAFQVFRI